MRRAKPAVGTFHLDQFLVEPRHGGLMSVATSIAMILAGRAY